ncbi:MAG: PQQ-binding-like beta-propeller repeat protein [Rubinisphaera brasiliensis]|uniref:outer membrane protein assembly factor BamB family protein n=1 Tax=Rubinisphaera brasiliensis TaxID=119 RepID=UPI00391B1F4E
MNGSAPSQPTSDAASQNAAETAEITPVAEQPKKRHWLRAWGVPAITILFYGLAIVLVRTLANALTNTPAIDMAVLNLITFSLGGAMVITVIGWFAFASYFSRRTVLIALGILLVASVGWAGTIKMVRFDGNMVPIFTYRWEQPPELQEAGARLAGHLDTFRIGPEDAPAFRGIKRDGVIQGPALNQDWQANPPQELWRTPVGEGYSSMAVVGNALITMEQRGENEAVTCYDVDTGELQWIHSYPGRFYEAMGGLGPRATPTIDQGRVFTMGANGDVCCLDFFNGEKVWQRNVLKDLDIPNVTWAMASSPLVVGEMVIVNPGAPTGNGLMALDRTTGETVWQSDGLTEYEEAESPSNHSGYSSPMLMTIGDVEQLIIYDGHGLSGHNPGTGELLWHFEHQNSAGVNVAQPILLENGHQLLISSSYGMGSVLVDVTAPTDDSGWKAEKVWHEAGLLRSKFSNPVYYEGTVYGLDDGILMAINPETGKKLWKKGRFGHGQVLLVNGQVLIMAEAGDLVLGDVSPDTFTEVTRMTVLPDSRVWNPQTLVDGIVYVRDDKEMAAFDLKAD